MTPSIFIARILGPVLLIIGVGLLLEGDTFRAMAGEFVRDQGLIYLTGILALAAGLAILNVHHLWTRDWRVLITIFGWLFLVGGIMRILAMSMARKLSPSRRSPMPMISSTGPRMRAMNIEGVMRPSSLANPGAAWVYFPAPARMRSAGRHAPPPHRLGSISPMLEGRNSKR